MLPKSDVVAVWSLKPRKRKYHVVAFNQRPRSYKGSFAYSTVARVHGCYTYPAVARVQLPTSQLQGFMAAIPI